MRFLNSAANFTSHMSFPAKNTLFQYFFYFLASGTKTGTQRSKGLNNCKITKFRDFASWSQKSLSSEICQNFKVFLSIKRYEIGMNNQIIT